MNKFKTISFSVLIIGMCLSPTIAETIDSKLILDIGKSNPNISPGLLEQAKTNPEAAMALANTLNGSGTKEKIDQGQLILKEIQGFFPLARIKLGISHLHGIPLVDMKTHSTVMYLKDAKEAVYWLEKYMDNPIKNNPRLIALVISFLTEGYIKTGKYKYAFILNKKNEELAKNEPTGEMANAYAKLYMEGLGTAKDLNKAHYWFSIASEKGNGMATVNKNWLEVEHNIK